MVLKFFLFPLLQFYLEGSSLSLKAGTYLYEVLPDIMAVNWEELFPSCEIFAVVPDICQYSLVVICVSSYFSRYVTFVESKSQVLYIFVALLPNVLA